ncbi:MAG: VWA domain-containing protein [Actinomycetes bacterium]
MRSRGERRDRAEARAFRYSAWDGTQQGFDLDAAALLDELSDDLMYHGDLDAALRRMMQEGTRDRNGDELMGLRDMLQRLRERRKEMLERHDLGGVYEDIAERLREVIDEEREGIERRRDDVARGGDEREQEIVNATADERSRQLDELSPDLAGRVQDLQRYEWMDEGARQKFEELLEELREQLMQSYFNQMSEGMQNLSPERMAQMKDMMAELNSMLEQRARGEEPDFEGFMDRHGEFFPGDPQSLDELLEQMARSMAQMQQLLNSMTPEQRAQIQALSDSLLEDMDLRWQLDQLSRNLQQAFPQLPWERSMDFRGDDPMSMGQMPGLLDQLGDLDDLEHLMRQATQPGELAEVDLDQVRDLLGDDAARSLERLAELAKMLEEAGLIEQREGRTELTPRGLRAIGQKALGDLYRKLMKDRPGRHELQFAGTGHDPVYEHKPYEWGDPFRLNVEETIKNAIWRQGSGTPVRLLPVDFEVERTEQTTTSATVLLLDVSMSMPMRDNFLPAKKVAMALHALITGQYPRDYFGLVSFGRVAREVKPEKLPEMSWDFEYGTNMHHALMIARRMLSKQTGTKQVIMVTDGEPTAHITPDGYAPFAYPTSHETQVETLKEVMRCTRDGIRINTFMLDDGWNLRSFVEQMCRINKGRAFYTTPDTLGDYVLVDFLEHRRTSRRAS